MRTFHSVCVTWQTRASIWRRPSERASKRASKQAGDLTTSDSTKYVAEIVRVAVFVIVDNGQLRSLASSLTVSRVRALCHNARLIGLAAIGNARHAHDARADQQAVCDRASRTPFLLERAISAVNVD